MVLISVLFWHATRSKLSQRAVLVNESPSMGKYLSKGSLMRRLLLSGEYLPLSVLKQFKVMLLYRFL